MPFRYVPGSASIPLPGEWRLHVRMPRHDMAWMANEAKSRMASQAAGDGAGGGLRLLGAVGQPVAP